MICTYGSDAINLFEIEKFRRFLPSSFLYLNCILLNMIQYTDTIAGITPGMLTGFFVGWPNPPSPETHLEVLSGSYAVVLAMHDERVVGFVNAISDGVLATFIPLLEVLPEYQGQGIGTELMWRMQDLLSNLYSLDLVCDPDVQPFYERMGWVKSVGMSRRNYSRQSGERSL